MQPLLKKAKAALAFFEKHRLRLWRRRGTSHLAPAPRRAAAPV
jgi:hypothetical protein